MIDDRDAPIAGVCAVCGAGIQRYGPRNPWGHKRPQPDGSPWTHAAVPTKARS